MKQGAYSTGISQKEEQAAYLDGLDNGAKDKRFSIGPSQYAWNGLLYDAPNTYSYHYSRGYRDGYLRTP